MSGFVASKNRPTLAVAGLSRAGRRLAVATLSVLLAGSGAWVGTAAASAAPKASPAAVPASSYTPPPVTFGTCSVPRLVAAGAECGTVTVPLDYSKPDGTKIQLAISRVRHKTPDAQYQGVMLVNPGGPGGSGLTLSTLQGRVPNGAGNSYDWIGFDPRGVGSSTPALSCDPGYEGYNRPYYVPETPRDEAAWIRKAGTYTAQCYAKYKNILPFFRTIDSVRDMDSIRQALGAAQINFYGFSYGTYLGSVYATTYPDKVRRMVLDGVVDPTRVWEQANDDQDVAFDRNIKIFFGWVAKYDSVYHLGTTEAAVEQQYYTQYQKLRTAPAAGKIGSSEWNDIFLDAGYYVFDWEDIASAFSSWVNDGDASGLVALYPAPTDDNGYAIYLATECSDAPWSSYPQFRQANAALYAKVPFETWGNAWFNAPCTVWPVKRGTPVTVTGAAIPPILLVSETLDAATPYSGALEVRKRFPQASLVEGVGGTTHAGTLFYSTCEDNIVAGYLATGTLPARVAGNRSDAQCAPNPQPVPAGAVANQRQARTAAPAPTRQPVRIPQRAVQGD